MSQPRGFTFHLGVELLKPIGDEDNSDEDSSKSPKEEDSDEEEVDFDSTMAPCYTMAKQPLAQ